MICGRVLLLVSASMCLFSEYKVCVWMSRSHISWVEGYVDSLLLTPWNRTCLCHNTLEPNTIAQIEALRRPSNKIAILLADNTSQTQ
jgi:hypothetical protein